MGVGWGQPNCSEARPCCVSQELVGTLFVRFVLIDDGRVVDWTGLHDIPQLRAYDRHKSGAQAIRIQNRKK